MYPLFSACSETDLDSGALARVGIRALWAGLGAGRGRPAKSDGPRGLWPCTLTSHVDRTPERPDVHP
jgi:hypothetical protein